MKRLWIVLLVLAVSGSATQRLGAVDLWPFNNESSRPTKKSGKSSWSFWPIGRKQGPSTLDKISGGTKKLWHQSTDWMLPDPQPDRRSPGQKPQTSLLGSLFRSAPPDPGPQTVGEWMNQPRLDP